MENRAKVANKEHREESSIKMTTVNCMEVCSKSKHRSSSQFANDQRVSSEERISSTFKESFNGCGHSRRVLECKHTVVRANSVCSYRTYECEREIFYCDSNISSRCHHSNKTSAEHFLLRTPKFKTIANSKAVNIASHRSESEPNSSRSSALQCIQSNNDRSFPQSLLATRNEAIQNGHRLNSLPNLTINTSLTTVNGTTDDSSDKDNSNDLNVSPTRKTIRVKRRPPDLGCLHFDISDEPSLNTYDFKPLNCNNEVKRRAGLWKYPDSSPEETDVGFPASNYAEIDEKSCVDTQTSNVCATKDQKTVVQRNNSCAAEDVKNSTNRYEKKKHVSAMELVRHGSRKLWCEISEVKSTGILEKLSPQQRQLQEALFEVITTEASYLRSISILLHHFVDCPEFSKPGIVEYTRDLFSNIADVFEVAKELMDDLENRWQKNLMIDDVCDILNDYANDRFKPYIKYCRFQKRQERTLKELLEKRHFVDTLKHLESHSLCQGLTLHSYILLPMQRVTRYPLLVEAILNRLSPQARNHQLCKQTLSSLNRLVNDCNIAAQQYKEFEEILPKLKFNGLKHISLDCASRWLLIQSEVTRIKPEFQATLLIGTISKNPYWSKSQNQLFLLNDMMLVTKKKKNEDCFAIYDYCYRSLIQINRIDSDIDPCSYYKPPESFKNCLLFTFLHNNLGKRVEYYFNYPSEKERIKWLISIELLQREDITDGIPAEAILKRCPRVPLKPQQTAITIDRAYDSERIAECTDEIFI